MANMEIERKFLVVPELFDEVELSNGVRIRQGYLAVETSGTEVRLREKGITHSLTVKSSGEMVRAEEEIDLSSEQFNRLWPLTEGRQIDKYRYAVPVGDVVAEVDKYLGDLAGLVTVEVEFTDIQQAESFEQPLWFGKDVTKYALFKNRNLAVRGVTFGSVVMPDGETINIPQIPIAD